MSQNERIRIEWDGENAQRAIKKTLYAACYAGAKIVENKARELVSRDGSGKIKGRRRKGTKPVRSLPGEPPMAQTKQLRQNITTEGVRSETRAKVGTQVEYGVFLETGTRKMQPRPWLLPALTSSKKQIEAMVQRLFGGLKK